MVLAMDEALRPEASGVASKLRKAGRSVELVLENKKMKWAFKVNGLRQWLLDLRSKQLKLSPTCAAR